MSNIETIRHSMAHLMAYAVQELYPDVKFGIGPAIEKGFYYDFDVDKPFEPEDLKKIEDKVKKLKRGEEPISHFIPAMFDYRNLLNVNMLDEVDKRDLLREEHHSKV